MDPPDSSYASSLPRSSYPPLVAVTVVLIVIIFIRQRVLPITVAHSHSV
jgi:hypothetical protein